MFEITGRTWNTIKKFCGKEAEYQLNPWVSEDGKIYATDSYTIMRWEPVYSYADLKQCALEPLFDKVAAKDVINFDKDFNFPKLTAVPAQGDLNTIFNQTAAEKNFSTFNIKLMERGINLAKAVFTETKEQPYIQTEFVKWGRGSDPLSAMVIHIYSLALGTFDVVIMPINLKKVK